jgi:hypothetical protein
MTYKLTDRFFSRIWRRTKRYSEHELRWLAKKRGLTLRHKGDMIQIIHPATKQVVAHFKGKETAIEPGPFGKLATKP